MRTKKTEMRFNRATHEPAWQKALPAGHGSSLGQPSTARGARRHERGLVPSRGGLPEQGGQAKTRCKDALWARGSSSANHLQRKGPRSCSATAQPPRGRALKPPAQEGDVRGHNAGSGVPHGLGSRWHRRPRSAARLHTVWGFGCRMPAPAISGRCLKMQLLPNAPPLPPDELLKAEASSRRVGSGRRGISSGLVAQPQPLLRPLLQGCSGQKVAKFRAEGVGSPPEPTFWAPPGYACPTHGGAGDEPGRHGERDCPCCGDTAPKGATLPRAERAAGSLSAVSLETATTANDPRSPRGTAAPGQPPPPAPVPGPAPSPPCSAPHLRSTQL